MSNPAPSRPTRIGVALAAGLLAFTLANHDGAQDFEQLHFAAAKMTQGADPYAVVGPGKARDQQWPLLYPGTALVLVTPLVPLSARSARIAFTVAGAAVLAFAMTRDGFGRVPLLASYSFLSACSLGQWTPWVAAGLLVPALGLFAAAKPNVGLAALTAMRTKRQATYTLAGCATLTALSLAVVPSWPAAWLEATRHAPANVPLMTALPLGPFLLLSLLRWRLPEGRLLAALSAVPQNPVPHSAVVMFAMPWRWWESALLAALSWGVIPWVYSAGADVSTYLAFADRMKPATVALIYLPMLLLVLARPNAAPDQSPIT